MIVGLTGGYCSGKSVLCDKLFDLGFKIIDIDLIGHRALEAKQQQIQSHFGSSVLDIHNKNIDKRKLGTIAFSNKKQLSALEAIVHPWMKEYIHSILHKERNTNIVINAALLFFLDLDRYCHSIVILKIPLWKRFIRALKRDSLGFIATLQRFLKQKPLPSNKTLKKEYNFAEIKIIKNSIQEESFINDLGRTLHGTRQQQSI